MTHSSLRFDVGPRVSRIAAGSRPRAPRASHLVDVTGGRSLAPQILDARARLAAKLGDAEQSNRLLQDAFVPYRNMGVAGHSMRLANELRA